MLGHDGSLQMHKPKSCPQVTSFFLLPAPGDVKYWPKCGGSWAHSKWPCCENILGCLVVSEGTMSPTPGDSGKDWRSTASEEKEENQVEGKTGSERAAALPELKVHHPPALKSIHIFCHPPTEATETSDQCWKGQCGFLPRNFFFLVGNFNILLLIANSRADKSQ